MENKYLRCLTAENPKINKSCLKAKLYYVTVNKKMKQYKIMLLSKVLHYSIC